MSKLIYTWLWNIITIIIIVLHVVRCALYLGTKLNTITQRNKKQNSPYYHKQLLLVQVVPWWALCCASTPRRTSQNECKAPEKKQHTSVPAKSKIRAFSWGSGANKGGETAKCSSNTHVVRPLWQQVASVWQNKHNSRSTWFVFIYEVSWSSHKRWTKKVEGRSLLRSHEAKVGNGTLLNQKRDWKPGNVTRACYESTVNSSVII